MIPFITYREQTDEGLEYFILQKSYPHYKCKIHGYPVKNFVEAVPISGFNLYLVFDGTLRGRYIPSYSDVDNEINQVMQMMALWFYEERIIKEEKKFKKFKIKVINDTIDRE